MCSSDLDELDNDHMILVGLINRVHDNVRKNRSAGVVGEVVEQLVAYTALHFDHEEHMMRDAAYPGLAEHHKQHEALKARAAHLGQGIRSGAIPSAGDELLQLLREWLVEHIQRDDRRFADHLARTTPRAA